MTEPMRPDMTDATDMADPTDSTDSTDPTGPTAAAPPSESPPPRQAAPHSRGTRDRWQKASDTGSLVWGFILLAIGGWFFIEHTLGYDLPRIDWGTVWPIVLIVIGGWIILRAAGRRSA